MRSLEAVPIRQLAEHLLQNIKLDAPVPQFLLSFQVLSVSQVAFERVTSSGGIEDVSSKVALKVTLQLRISA